MTVYLDTNDAGFYRCGIDVYDSLSLFYSSLINESLA
jgi:hypothetical protein